MIAGIGWSGLARGKGTGRQDAPSRLRAGRVRREQPSQEEPAAPPDPAPRRTRAPLDELQRPPAPLPAPARAAAAARAFAAGNGYLTGLLVDRII